MGDRLELLAPRLLAEQREAVGSFRSLAASLAIPLGWHYLLDLAWVSAQVPAGARVLDAGAGAGVLQWWLAERGHEVVSVDRVARAQLPLHFRARYQVAGLRPSDLAPAWQSYRSLLPWWLARTAVATWRGGLTRRGHGRVLLYDHDMASLPDLADASVDAVVSISALEHNSPDRLPGVVAELMRVLRPGGVLLATVGAARDADWFHEPSSGWCYSEATLRRLFGLDPGATSDFAGYDSVLEQLRSCDELRRGLAFAYYRSGRNGMPWGHWNPTYLSVGVRREKHA